MKHAYVVAAVVAGGMVLGNIARAQAPAAVALQVDVLAVDRDGRPAAGLAADDFELRDGGKTQKVLQARYVAPAEARRTIVFLVDDLGLSFRSAAFVREAMKRFVDEQMRADDRVAVVRSYSTYSDTDTTQTTTSDKKALQESVARVRYNAMQRGPRTSFYDVRYDSIVQATMQCLHAVVRDLSAVPGRKAVVLFSDGIDANLGPFGFIDPGVRGPLEEIVEAANRGGVVVYAVEAGGLPGPFSRSWQSSSRQGEQFPLRTLARETGGLFVWNTDVERALGRIMESEGGHYVLEYQSTVPAGKAHEIDVKVRKPGIKARTRREVFAPARDGA